MAGFSPTYSVGGVLDEIKKINFPPHLFPTKTNPFTKGFRMQVPAMKGVYDTRYTVPQDMELIDVGLACSGYSDGDYWELSIGGNKIMETIYTKELPQHINMGTTLYCIEKIPAGTEILLQFYNESATAKTVWFDLRFLK
jgi:hypothetical protein